MEIVLADWTTDLWRNVFRLLRKAGPIPDLTRSVIYSYIASMEASLRLRLAKGDVILSLGGTMLVYAVKTSRPIISISDATFASISRIYPDFATMPRWLREDADRIERTVLHRSNRVLLCSDWAKSSAIIDYGVSPGIISVLPLGPNIGSKVIDSFRSTKSADFSDGIRLLFIGADWHRKGGPVVLDIKRLLDSRGIPCELFIVGNCPKDITDGNGIRVLGRLNKSDPKQLQALCKLYESAHFFVLPTSAEAFGVVFSEAQAFGCPSLTYAVGGTPTAVLDGTTGFTLPLGATAQDFAEKICSLVRDPQQYERMSANCRARYETEANWSTWARAVVELADQLLEETRASLSPHNL
jgi:glycosyltransferase involved in cell wall biosynthesis